MDGCRGPGKVAALGRVVPEGTQPDTTRPAAAARARTGVGMDWQDLQAFHAVAEELSFTRAAERMRLSQPSLSSRVRRLERVLGVQLLYRSSRGVVLSAPGRRLLRYVHRLNHMWYRAVADVRTSEQRMVLATTIPELACVVSATQERFPHLRPEYELRTPGTALPYVGLGGYDAVQGAERLFAQPPVPLAVEIETIAHEPVWLLLADRHPLAGQAVVRLDQLAGEAWVEASESREELVGMCAPAGFTPDIRYLGAGLHLLEGVRNELAVSLVPAHVVPPEGCVVRPLDADVRRHLFYAAHVDVPREIAVFQRDFLRASYRRLAFRNPGYRELIEAEPDRFRALAQTPEPVVGPDTGKHRQDQAGEEGKVVVPPVPLEGANGIG
ncbi:hypothetical protein GCM10012275_13880 [Longimycelium tulufanense]|uniref:HTH lysR-type domain-containing protein n=1 Tax=Longimycelium tulufanense TaxID=907463 RepID=A0A8J3FTU3_9PSEU|nr:LysR family transcriptional regulator [Longimycelium tulufanense]GGM44078.1 hypothetical protein GCM10012275_13880 [Longimycelium tulufanense]